MRTFESLVEKRPKSIAIDRWIGPNGFFSDKENIGMKSSGFAWKLSLTSILRFRDCFYRYREQFQFKLQGCQIRWFLALPNKKR
jgi:hypothetical protein